VAESDFSEKNPFAPFLGQKGPKQAQNEVFGIFMKVESFFGPRRSRKRSYGFTPVSPSVRPSVCL